MSKHFKQGVFAVCSNRPLHEKKDNIVKQNLSVCLLAFRSIYVDILCI